VVVDAVPVRADGWVADRWSHRIHLGFGQDARSKSRLIKNHSIDLVAKKGDLLLEVIDDVGLAGVVVDGVDLDDEIRDRRVNLLLPCRDIFHLVLDRLEVVGIDARLKGGEALIDLLHLIEEKLGVGVHGATDSLLKAGVVGMVSIQHGAKID
jgi:hypothetical protein